MDPIADEEGLTEVAWGLKWRGFSFAEVIRADPGFANHVHRFVHKTEAQISFLAFARGRLTNLEYSGLRSHFGSS